jgi:hypothetical protein
MKAVLVAVILSLAPLAAAAQDPSPTTLSKGDARGISTLARVKQHAAKERIAGLSKAELSAALTANLSDVTKIIYQDGYGVYVEYSAADGRDRMWFPGNVGVVKGVWGVREMGGGPRACFHYFNSRNAVTGEFESTECVPPEQTLGNGDVIDQRPGDAFNLLSDHIPYRKAPLSVPAWPAAVGGKPGG